MQLVLLENVEPNSNLITLDNFKISIDDYINVCTPSIKEFEKQAAAIQAEHTAFNNEWEAAKTSIQQKINECKKVRTDPIGTIKSSRYHGVSYSPTLTTSSWQTDCGGTSRRDQQKAGRIQEPNHLGSFEDYRRRCLLYRHILGPFPCTDHPRSRWCADGLGDQGPHRPRKGIC